MTARLWLRSWLPAVCWAALIWTFSTRYFSTDRTAAFIEPFLRWIYPAISCDQLDTIHFLIRKTAHFTEYLVFCLLLYRGLRGEGRGWRWTWALAAFAAAAGYSLLDEVHQSFVAERTASAFDSLLDSAGALTGMIVYRLWTRLRRSNEIFDVSSPAAPPA